MRSRAELVDVVAAAIWENLPGVRRWENIDASSRDFYRQMAENVLDVLRADADGEWCPEHGVVNLGDPWSWDYNDDHRPWERVERLVVVPGREP